MRKVKDLIGTILVLGVGLPMTLVACEKAACLLDKLLMSAMAML